MSDAWDGRPPEEWRDKNGWHWLPIKKCPIAMVARWWNAETQNWPELTYSCADLKAVADYYEYAGPCLPPDEVVALRERAERAEAEVIKAIGYLTRNCLAPRKAKPHDDLMGICTQVDHLLSTARAEALREASWIAQERESEGGEYGLAATHIAAAIRALIEKEKTDGA